MQAVGVVIAAYSAVKAVQSLKDGNILGAVLGGIGAFVGLSGAGAFASQTAADATALSATDAVGNATGTMFGEGGLGSLATEGAGLSPSVLNQAITGGVNDIAGSVGADMTALGGSSAAGLTNATMPDISIKTPGAEFMDNVSNSITDIKDAVGEVVHNASGYLEDTVGNLFDPNTKALVGKNGSLFTSANVLGGLQLAGGLYSKAQSEKSAKERADELYARQQQEAARQRASRGATPNYVYDFTRGKRKTEGVLGGVK